MSKYFTGGVLEDASIASPLDSGNAKHKTYLLDITEKQFVDGKQARYNASGKPRTDTVATLEEMDATLIELHSLPVMTTQNKWKKKILWRANIANLLQQGIRKCSTDIHDAIIFAQYPFISCPRFVAKYILGRLRNNGNRLIFIIHDIESIRHEENKDADREILNFADAAVVHSPQMGRSLRTILDKDINTVSLGFFDYRSPLCIDSQKDLRKVCLIFAGNLSKAPFIEHLSELPLKDDFQINLYGAYSPLIHENQYVHYNGKFDADDFSSIEGNWGLVWDGNSLDTCSGELGEYLKINSPFKFSLYLAANRPVVVWQQSAMAQYVEQQHLGICVDSLKDIPTAISNLSDSELEEIKQAVAEASADVRGGIKLKQASKKTIDALCECNTLNINSVFGGG